MIKLGRRGIPRSYVTDVFFDNQDYEIIIYLDEEKVGRNCDEIQIYCDNVYSYLWNVLKVRIKLLIF